MVAGKHLLKNLVCWQILTISATVAQSECAKIGPISGSNFPILKFQYSASTMLPEMRQPGSPDRALWHQSQGTAPGPSAAPEKNATEEITPKCDNDFQAWFIFAGHAEPSATRNIAGDQGQLPAESTHQPLLIMAAFSNPRWPSRTFVHPLL
ncbi:hypothetical protein AAHC03_09745 [Spirometra sp. Aus1]